MIEDFDGPDPAPTHRGHMFAVSLLLLVGVVVGYATVSSPELRGPFATPRPSVAVDIAMEPARGIIDAPIRYITTDAAPAAVGCLRIVVPPETNVFVAGHSVTFVRVLQLPRGVETGIAIGPNGATGVMGNACDNSVILYAPELWGQPPSPIPFQRVAP